ncbi:MAG: hypothetical protein KDC92_13655 [Bacteroidetes bacterium]|nr:hypothetical protein [Bacteroidota bacterium]
MKWLMAILIAFACSACQHEPIPEPEPDFKPISVYKNPIDLDRVDELPCEVIPQISYYEYKDSPGFIYDITQNQDNPNQWAFTRFYPMGNLGNEGYFKLFIANLTTGQHSQLDSAQELRLFSWTSGFVVYDDWFHTFLLDPTTKHKHTAPGMEPSVSPNGEFMAIYDFVEDKRREVVSIPSFESAFVWKNREFFNKGIWLKPNLFYSIDDFGNFKMLNCSDFSLSTVYENDLLLGWPECWIEPGRILVTSAGYSVDLESGNHSDYLLKRNCNNRSIKRLINLRSEKKILITKDYYDYFHDDENPDKWALYYRRFHIIDYNGTNEQRVELKFE